MDISAIIDKNHFRIIQKIVKKKELLTGVTQAKNNESKPKCFDFIFLRLK